VDARESAHGRGRRGSNREHIQICIGYPEEDYYCVGYENGSADVRAYKFAMSSCYEWRESGIERCEEGDRWITAVGNDAVRN